jgi:diphthamide synthase (EF-2-diphthine--ammonia ligase)
MKNIVLNWSSGKDAAFAFNILRNDKKYNISALLTTISAPFERVSMHGTRLEILEKQAELMQVPLEKIIIPENADMETYNKTMHFSALIHQNTQEKCLM